MEAPIGSSAPETLPLQDASLRPRAVAKLMFMHMMGYPTHFGQMECLKLISAPGFPEKRIGYLALTLLLTEQTEVLTLVTNSLKVDLGNSNQFTQGLNVSGGLTTDSLTVNGVSITSGGGGGSVTINTQQQ